MIHKPGIYFGMTDAEYHADPSLSTSGIKKLVTDPEEYWDQSAMNPNRPPDEVKDALVRGKLWHCAILEPENFDAKYALSPTLTGDFGDKAVLKTMDDMKSWLDANGVYYKKSGNKTDLEKAVWEAWRLGAGDPEPYLFDRENANFAVDNAGRTVIWGAKEYNEMLAAKAVIDGHPYFSQVFAGGYAEVSIFWTDAETGIPMKARLDKLKPRVILDYKTMHVPRMKPARKAALDAIKFEKYDVQVAVYTIGLANVINSILAGTAVIEGDVEGAFIDELIQSVEKPFGFVFQKEDRPYTVRGLKVVRRGGDLFNVFGNGLVEMQRGIELYRRFKELYGDDRWIDPEGMIEVQDHDIYYS